MAPHAQRPGFDLQQKEERKESSFMSLFPERIYSGVCRAASNATHLPPAIIIVADTYSTYYMSGSIHCFHILTYF